MFLLYWNEKDPPVPPEVAIQKHPAIDLAANAVERFT
jgi:hypothetical protein